MVPSDAQFPVGGAPSREQHQFTRLRFFRHRGFLTVAVLAAVLLFLFHESLFCGKGLVPSDAILTHLPWSQTTRTLPSNPLLSDQYNTFIPQHQFVQHEVRRGSFPLWNPHQDCGAPNLASMQGALLFPIQLLLSPIDPFYASGIAAFLKLLLAGTFTILYLRRLGASHAAALLSGLIFCLSGFMIVWLGHPHVNAAIWLPCLLYFIEGQFCRPSPSPAATSDAAVRMVLSPPPAVASDPASLRNWIGFAVGYGFMLLGGHPPTAIHVTFVVTAYFGFRLASEGGGRCLRLLTLFGCFLLAGMLLAAPQILPYLEYYRVSSSPLASAALNRWATHLHGYSLIHFLVPFASGSPAAGYEDLPALLGLGNMDNFNERTGYVGIVTLFLVLCCIWGRRCKITAFYAAAAALSLLVILGVPPLPAIAHQLPIINAINPTRLLLVLGFALAVLAGLGLDTLTKMEVRRRRVMLAAFFWIVIGGFLFWFGTAVGPRFSSLDAAHQGFLLRQLPVLAGGLLIPLAAVLQPKRFGTAFPAFICIAWTAFDLLWFAWDYNPSISYDRYYPQPEVVKFLKHDASPFRILGTGDILPPNTASVFGLDDARGCDFMAVKRYEELVSGGAGDFFFYSFASYLPRVLPLLNVKYIITPARTVLDHDDFELVYSNEVAVYRFKPCLERALVVYNYKVCRDPKDVLRLVHSENFDARQVLLLEEDPQINETPPAMSPKAPSQRGADLSSAGQVDSETSGRDASAPLRQPQPAGQSARPASVPAVAATHILSYGPDRVTIEASLTRPGFLLLLDPWFPGWKATANGKPARIYQADYNFRAVLLPAGHSLVSFAYKPASLAIGWGLALASLALLVSAWFWTGASVRRRRSAA
jgi:hypothetical protein